MQRWFPYRVQGRVRGVDLWAPELTARIRHGGLVSGPLRLLVDSGACRTALPCGYADDLDLSFPTESRRWIGLSDAHGKGVYGWEATVEVLIPDLPPITEPVWFCEGLRLGVLGQAGWFESLAIRFHNWPQARSGRKFQLVLRPR